MNISNLPYPSAYKHRLQAASAINSSPVTVSSRRTTDVSEIKQQQLTPLDHLFEEIQRIAVENALNPNADFSNYLLLRDAYMEENISPQSPSRSEIMAVLTPLAEQMSLAKAKRMADTGLPSDGPMDFFQMVIKYVFDGKKPEDSSKLFIQVSPAGNEVQFPVRFSVNGAEVTVVDPGYMIVRDQNGKEILSYSAPPGAGSWIPSQTVGEAMFIEQTNLAYQKAFDAAWQSREEQEQAAAKPSLNTTA